MKAAHALRVTLLGPDIDHRRSLEAMLGGGVGRLTWLSDSSSLMRKPTVAPSMGERLRRGFDQLTHTRHPHILEHCLRHIDEQGTDVLVAYWGTTPLPDIAAIKRHRPNVKIVLMVLCYPLSFDRLGAARQHWQIRRAARHLDGLMFPNSVMQQYFQDKVLRSRGGHLHNVVVKPCWPRSFQPLERPAPVDDKPNLIFVGRTDLSHHTVHVADDLRATMAEILGRHIHLHHVRSPETSDGNPYRHPFDPMVQQALIRRMAAHDASLIKYNEHACTCADRLNLTVPDRLITSVAAGVPIAVQSTGYAGALEYLAEHPGVIRFSSIADLQQQLSDRARIDTLRDAAWKARELYAAEAQAPVLLAYLEQLANRPAVTSSTHRHATFATIADHERHPIDA